MKCVTDSWENRHRLTNLDGVAGVGHIGQVTEVWHAWLWTAWLHQQLQAVQLCQHLLLDFRVLRNAEPAHRATDACLWSQPGTTSAAFEVRRDTAQNSHNIIIQHANMIHHHGKLALDLGCRIAEGSHSLCLWRASAVQGICLAHCRCPKFFLAFSVHLHLDSSL